MPRTAFAAVTPKGPFTGLPTAGQLDYVATVGDAINGNEVAWVGNRMLVLAENSDGATPYTMTITSVASSRGRLGTVTAYSLAAADRAAFLVERDGWQQSGGLLYLDCDNAAIFFTVLALP